MTPIPLHHIESALRADGLLLAVAGDLSASVRGASADSRTIGSGDLFVAVSGTQMDGHAFVDRAVAQGAVAVAVERMPESRPDGVVCLHVTDTRKALAIAAATIAGRPAENLTLVGVTGTNGKTTTAWMVAQAMEVLGRPFGFVGTIGWGRPDALAPTRHTTPDPSEMQRLFMEGESESWSGCALEVSSHALTQHRVYGLKFSAAAFTNLSHDHLDYHGDMPRYAAAKGLLFESLSPDATAIVNGDDPYVDLVFGASKAHRVNFGTGPKADIRYRFDGDLPDGMRLDLDGVSVTMGVSGAFNAANAAAAYGVLRTLGVDSTSTRGALSHVRPAPGRFERVMSAGGKQAIVDYAHTPDALENLLRAARGACSGRLFCVFGCGGDRDAAKRPSMGRIAEQLADRVILTSDNPRSEDPEAILDDIASGLQRPEAAERWVDRRQAIERAVRAARPDDLVVVAGKGHEAYQVVGDRVLDFDDRAVIREVA